METGNWVLAAGTGAGLLAGWLMAGHLAPGGGPGARAAEPSRGLGWRAGLAGLTGALFAVMTLRFGASPLLPAACYLAAAGVALAVVDLRERRLPDRLTLPSYPVALVLLGGGGLLLPRAAGHLAGALAGLTAAAAFFLLLALVRPGDIGWGDVKLSGLLGFYLGWFGAGALLAGLLGAFVLAAFTGLGLIAAGRATRKSQLPFGPFMIAAALAVIALGGAYPPLTH
jgi:leader peptidase (prepilin peptidase)/N-methyltransferase